LATTQDVTDGTQLVAATPTARAVEEPSGTASGRVRKGPARLSPRGVLTIALVLASLYALGALLPFWFLTSPEAGAAFFPAAGLTFAVMVLTDRRLWPLWVVIIVAVELAVDLTHDVSFSLSLVFAAANSIEPVVGALLLLTWWRRDMSPRTGLAQFIVGPVVIAPLVGGFIAATGVWMLDDLYTPWAELLGRWALGDALGVLVLGSAILAFTRPQPFEPRAPAWETALFAVGAIAITIVPAVLWHHPMIYAVLPVLIYAALRGGTRSVVAVSVAVAFAADWAAVTGRADDLVAAENPDTALVWVQLFLAVTILAALAFSVEVSSRLRAEYLARQAEVDRAAAADGERRRIARETHDIVGHALNVMLLQAGAARRSLASDTEQAQRMLERLEETGREAFGDLDVALGLVDRTPNLPPGRGLDAVAELVERIGAAGISIQLSVEGPARELSTLVDWSAYRILQEALTNVVKHAPGAQVAVNIAYIDDDVVLVILDDGGHGRRQRRRTPFRNGRGIIGMRERVAVLGGDIHTGREPGGGFGVRVRLPVQGALR
jgi:signal transduction histidine kinase